MKSAVILLDEVRRRVKDAQMNDEYVLHRVAVLAIEKAIEAAQKEATQLRTRAKRAEAALGEAAGAAADEMVDYGKSAQQAVFHAVKAVARKALQQTTEEENER